MSAFLFVISLTSDYDIESLVRVSEKQGQDQTSAIAKTQFVAENRALPPE